MIVIPTTHPGRLHVTDERRATELVTLCQQANIFIPGLASDKRNDQTAASMAIGKALTHLFDEAGEHITVEDFVVTRRIEQASGDSQKEFESKTYSFRRRHNSDEPAAT